MLIKIILVLDYNISSVLRKLGNVSVMKYMYIKYEHFGVGKDCIHVCSANVRDSGEKFKCPSLNGRLY